MDLGDLYWIILGENSLEEGKLVGISEEEEYLEMPVNRIKRLEAYFKKNYIDMPKEKTEEDFISILTDRGNIVIHNMGRVQNKYGAIVYLPEEITPKQKETLESMQYNIEQLFHLERLFITKKKEEGAWKEISTSYAGFINIKEEYTRKTK